MSIFPNLDAELVEAEGKIIASIHASYHAMAALTEQGQAKIMSAFSDLKASVEAYITASEAQQATVAQAVAAAVAADDAGRDVDLTALKAEVDAAIATVPAAPVVPAAAPTT